MSPTTHKPTTTESAMTATEQRLATLQKQLNHHSDISIQHQLALKKAQNTLIRIKDDMKLIHQAIEKLDAMTDKSREAFACAHIKRANLEIDFNAWTAVRLQHEGGIKEHGLKMGEVRKEIYAAEKVRVEEAGQ